MIQTPGFRMYVDTTVSRNRMEAIETTIPGALVHVRLPSRTWPQRLHKVNDIVGAKYYTVSVSTPGSYLVSELLGSAVFDVKEIAQGSAVMPYPKAEGKLERDGLLLAQELASKKLLTSWMLKDSTVPRPTPYQYALTAWAANRSAILIAAPPGAGKTRSALMAAVARLRATEGPVVIVCPSKARKAWRDQIPIYIGYQPYRLIPKSEQRAGHRTLADYLSYMQHTKRRPYVIVGSEGLPNMLDRVLAINPVALIFDELHEFSSFKRITAVPERDGTVSYHTRLTPGSRDPSSKVTDRVTRAAALMNLSRCPSLKIRIGVTATLLFSGEMAKTYAPFDLVWPGVFGWGNYAFRVRYANGKQGDYGFESKGASNLKELRERCSFFIQNVHPDQVAKYMPATRTEIVRLEDSDLCRADAYTAEIKRTAKEYANGLTGRDDLLEVRLSKAASTKKKWCAEETIEAMRNGEKVVIFTARRHEVDKLYAYLLPKVKRAMGWNEATAKSRIRSGHGGLSDRDCDGLLNWFKGAIGATLFIGTGQRFGTSADDLKSANLALIAMLPWTPGALDQWRGRFSRLGGAATLIKIAIAVGTYDDKMASVLERKYDTVDKFFARGGGLGDQLIGLDDEEQLLDDLLEKLNLTKQRKS